MSLEAILEPSRERPVLPTDRDASRALLDTFNAHFSDAESMAKATGLPWAARLLARPQTASSVDSLLRSIDNAARSIKDLERHLDIIHSPGKGPRSVESAQEHLTALIALTENQTAATIASAISQSDLDAIATLVEDAKHHTRCQTRIAEAIESDLPMDEARGFVLVGAAAADALREDFDCDGLDSVEALIDGLDKLTPTIERRVRRLMVLPARLDVPDVTLGEIGRIAAACAAARALPPEMFSRLSESAPEMEDVVRMARDKAAKIVNAGALLDESLGKAWRSEPLDKLSQALKMSEVPGHPSHKKIADYMRSIGVTTHVRSHLEAIVKTRSGMATFESDAGLKRLMPKSFSGLSTDFAPVLAAIDARRSLAARLEGLPAADGIMASICSISNSVAQEFVSFADLEDDVNALGMPAETRLDQVRLVHAEKIGRLRALRQEILNMPVPAEQRTTADARRLGRLIREAEGTLERIEGNELYRLSGARSSLELVKASDWHAALKAMLPEDSLPQGDHAFAQLHVHARAAGNAATTAASALAHLRSGLPAETAPASDLDLRDALAALDRASACEPVLHAQVIVCESMAVVLQSELGPFIRRMQTENVRSQDWRSRLEEDFVLLDRMIAEDLAAESIAKAALDAAPAQIVPTDMGGEPPEEVASFDDDAWDEQDFAALPAMSVDRVVQAEVAAGE